MFTVALTVAIAPLSARAVELPKEAPLPELRPYLPSEPLSASVTAIFGRLFNPEVHQQRLKSGLAALAAGDIETARRARSDLPRASLEGKLLTWAIATSGNREVSSSEIAEAMQLLHDWPGQARLEAARERALFRENAMLHNIPSTYAASPRTFEGMILLARAHLAGDDPDAARALIAPWWRTEMLTERQEDLIVNEFGSLLSADDHRVRAERMLYAGEPASAERTAHLAGFADLISVWRAVSRNAPDAEKLLEEVPEAQRSAAWAFLKARHLRRRGDHREAAEFILSLDAQETATVDADAWWNERRALSRELLDDGEPELAYRVAASQQGGKPVTLVDSAFHAGWYALRFLDNPETAAGHFRRIIDIADGSISKARGHYWLARAAEAGAPDIDATQQYALAAGHPTAFYGQLAAAKLGRTALEFASPEVPDKARAAFAFREPVRAIRLLEDLGFRQSATTLYRDLANDLESVEELTILVEMAEQAGNHYLALRTAKAGAARGLSVGGLTHRVGVIPKGTQLSEAGEALAYAIARQESEFNVGAISSAGARGLLQLMPATAREVARKSGLPYSAPRLTSDAGYSATLGAAYLDEQLSRFDGSYILTFAGYNAGPARAIQWTQRYGDPRGKPLDEVIDWIERIPFTETRSYVQRVMENYQVYKYQLTGRFEIERDLVEGR